MNRIRGAWWLFYAAVTAAWLMVEPGVFTTTSFIPLRNLMVQYSGLLAIASPHLRRDPVGVGPRAEGHDEDACASYVGSCGRRSRWFGRVREFAR
jgi:hypothetical protein